VKLVQVVVSVAPRLDDVAAFSEVRDARVPDDEQPVNLVVRMGLAVREQLEDAFIVGQLASSLTTTPPDLKYRSACWLACFSHAVK
jgi:hypothetical protein